MTKNKQAFSYKLVILVIATLLLGLFLGSYFTFHRLNDLKKRPKEISQWRAVQFYDCNMSFAIPPQEEPYFYPEDLDDPSLVTEDKGSGRYWDIPRGSMWPAILYLLDYSTEEIKQMNTMFASPKDASGYISAAVSVSCVDNNGNLDNNSLSESLRKEVNTYNANKEAIGMMPEYYTVDEITEITMWGKPALLVRLNDTEYYVFTTTEKIYVIQKIVGSDDKFVQQTAEDILNNLTIY